MRSVSPAISASALAGREVFLSHSTADAELCRAACAALEEAGVSCWVAPRDILPSQTWSGAIVDGVTGCRVLVVALSRRSNASPEVLREVELAAQRRKPVLAWRIDDVTPNGGLEYFLSATQWLDAAGRPLHARLDALVRTVQVLLGESAPRPASESATAAVPFADVDLDDFGAPRGRVSGLFDRFLRDR